MRGSAVLLCSVVFGCASTAPSATVKPWERLPTSEAERCIFDQLPDRQQHDECAAGNASACVLLTVDPRRSEAELGFARTHLQRDCKIHPVCGCYAYGEALLRDRNARFAAEAVENLRLSCTRGGTDACERISYLVEECNKSERRGRTCQALADEGRLEPKGPIIGPVELPESLRGCFVVSTDDRTLTRKLAVPAAEIGSLYCLESDRVSFKSMDQDWDQLLTVWLADVDHPTMYKTSQGLLFEPTRGGVRLTGLGRAAMLKPRADVSPLSAPRLERICDHARRCAGPPKPPSIKGDLKGFDALALPRELTLPPGLASCLELERKVQASPMRRPPGCD